MQIFIFSKKNLFFNFFIICTISIILFYSLSFAANFYNTNISPSNFMEDISNITKQKEKIAYLTFDDGPSLVTPKILDILGNENVKASFFVIGKYV